MCLFPISTAIIIFLMNVGTAINQNQEWKIKLRVRKYADAYWILIK